MNTFDEFLENYDKFKGDFIEFCLHNEQGDMYYTILNFTGNSIIITDWIGGSHEYHFFNQEDYNFINSLKLEIFNELTNERIY